MRPTPRAIWVLGSWVTLAAMVSFWPALRVVWLGSGIGIAVFALLDIVYLRRVQPPSCKRTVPKALAVGNWHTVELRLSNPGGTRADCTLFDGYPVNLMQEGGLPLKITIPARSVADLSYQVRATLRGTAVWTQAQLLRSGPAGLLARTFWVGEQSHARVYPDFRQVAKFSMLAIEQRISQMGIHVRPKRGEGLEFFQLRDYRDGDSLRQVDWKASARRRTLISREYREEQNQQLIILLDCGRGMHARDGELSHFDHVLNSALLLSHVALREGDAVGMISFSGVNRYVAPVKGAGAIHRLVGQMFDLSTSNAPSDYAEAVSRVSARQRRRALVVLLTNLRDDDSHELPKLLAPLLRRHLVLVGSMRETALEQASDSPVTDFEGAVTVSSALHYLEQRRIAHEGIRRAGVSLIDVTPDKLAVALVNSYLDIKSAGRL